MKLYSCKVRLGGNVNNEVRKEAATAAEITILKVIHGDDAVADITEVGETDRSDAQERDRLMAEYQIINDMNGPAASLVNKLFGPSTLPLPKAVAGFEPVKEPTVALPAKKPGRKAKVVEAPVGEAEPAEGDPLPEAPVAKKAAKPPSDIFA